MTALAPNNAIPDAAATQLDQTGDVAVTINMFDDLFDDVFDQVYGVLGALADTEDDLDKLSRSVAEALGISPAWHEHRLPLDIADGPRDLRASLLAAGRASCGDPTSRRAKLPSRPSTT